VAQRFVCWHDGTDLTAGVENALQAAPHGPVVMRNGQSHPSPDWRIVIKCPTDQVDNLFASQIATQQPPTATITGAPPSAGDSYLAEAAKEIGPDKSLTRAGDSAKFTIDKIALVALVLGGFGIFTDLGGGFSAHRQLFAAVVIAAAAALALSIWALFPKREANVNYNNLVEVQTAYASAINRRVRFAQLASMALLVALALALAAFFKSGGKDPDAAIATSWDGSGDKPVLSFTVDMKDLPTSATPTIVLIGLKKAADESGTTLSQATVTRSRLGTAKVDEKLVPRSGFTAYRVEARLSWDGGKKKRTEIATLQPPPFTKPAANGKAADAKTASPVTPAITTTPKTPGGDG
jgi:hypothetical protein